MIEERARIINAKDPNATSETTRVMIIGKNLRIRGLLQGLLLNTVLATFFQSMDSYILHHLKCGIHLNFSHFLN